MVRIIDLECSLPRRETDPPESAPAEAAAPDAEHTAPRSGYGIANYGRIFRSRAEGDNRGPAMPMDAYMDKLASVGIEQAIPFGASNEETIELLRAYPG